MTRKHAKRLVEEKGYVILQLHLRKDFLDSEYVGQVVGFEDKYRRLLVEWSEVPLLTCKTIVGTKQAWIATHKVKPISESVAALKAIAGTSNGT